jgi:hypothetical protein
MTVHDDEIDVSILRLSNARLPADFVILVNSAIVKDGNFIASLDVYHAELDGRCTLLLWSAASLWRDVDLRNG